MTTHEYQLLIRHEMWASQRIAEMLLEMEQIPVKAKELMNHLIGAQLIWISRINGTEEALSVFPEIDSDLWYANIASNEDALLEILSEGNRLNELIHYKNTKGDAFENTVSEILLHLAMHSQYHRGQIVAYSRHLLEKVPSTDMIAFLRIK